MKKNNVSTLSIFFPITIISSLVIGFMSNDLYLASMPALTGVFHVSDRAIQLSITGWFAGSIALQLFLGPLSDVCGRKPIFLASILLLVIASLICAGTSFYSLFLLGRLLQGIAVSGIMVIAFASIHEAYHAQGDATKMMGYVGMGSALAPICGPALGGFVYSYLGWQANFIIVSAIGAILFLILLYLMPETKPSIQQKREPYSIIYNYTALLSNVAFLFSILSYGFLFLAGGAFLTGIPFVYVNIFNISLKYVGIGISPMLMAYMIAAGYAGKIEKSIGTDKLLKLAFSFVCLLMLIFLISGFLPKQRLYSVIVPMVGYYIALGLIGPPLNHISLSYANDSNKGSASALLTFTMMLGCAIGSLLVGIFYKKTFFSFSCIIVFSVFLSFFSYIIFVKAKNMKQKEKNIFQNNV